VFVIRAISRRNFRSFEKWMTTLEHDAGPLVSLADYGHAARSALTERAHAYIEGGAGDETTLADNPAAWNRLALAPRVLTGAGTADTTVTVLGRPRPHPVIIAPTAFAALTHPDGETAIARGAAATATTICLSTLASTPPAALADAVPEVSRWCQLYVFTDRGVTRELIATAENHGYEALVLTADRPVLGVRGRERHHDVRGATSPGVGAAVNVSAPSDFSARIDATLTWGDVADLASQTALPVVVKGILTPGDARLARDHGAAGVVVSNHGGRQLDTVLSGADALPAVVDAVAGEIDVLVDGGIRRGTDVVKALALGAKAVMVGRPILWGLAVDGATGVQRVLELLLGELATALVLTGAGAVGALGPDDVLPAPWARP
jgi:isopentenyl diphosphate isomerase/L-lactate dehydrogenase-like FMN-dependent dehydrogenase